MAGWLDRIGETVDRMSETVGAYLERRQTPYLRRFSIPVEQLERAQHSVAGRLVSWQSRTPEYPPANWRTFVTTGYRQNAPFRRCVDMLSTNVCQGRLQVEDVDTGEPVKRHPLVDLFRRGGRVQPVPGLTEATMWTQFIQDAYSTGNALWEKVRGFGTNEVLELWRLEPQRVAIEPDSRLGIKRYYYQVGGKWSPIPRENVVHWRFPDPLQPWFGIPPVYSARRDLSVDNELTDHFKITLQNHAVPAVVLEHDEVIDEKQADEARRKWRKNQGRWNKGDVAIVGGKTRVNVVGLDMQKMQIGALVAVPESRIAMVHGVPIILLGRSGTQSDPTRANYAEAKEHFWFDTVLPLLEQIGQQVSLFLLPEWDPDGQLVAKFDVLRVAIVMEALLRRGRMAAEIFESTLISRHHAQRLAGQPRHGLDTFWGDVTESTEA